MKRKKIIIGMVIVLAANIAGYVLVSRSTSAEQRALDHWAAAAKQDERDFKAAHVNQKIDEKYLEDEANLGNYDSARYKSEQNAEIRWRSDVYFYLQMLNLFAALIAMIKLLRLSPKSKALRPSIARTATNFTN